MIETEGFSEWLRHNTEYTAPVIKDMVSRVKRADKILVWSDEEVYQFYLDHEKAYTLLSVSVRSQIRRAVKLYREYRISK